MKIKSFNVQDQNFKSLFISFIKVILSGLLLGLAYSKWMVPNEIINGGVTSLSMILSKMTPLNVDFYTQMLTLVFLLLSFMFLGKKNFFLSIVSSLAYTQFFSLFYRMDFSLQINLPIDFLLSCLFISVGYYLSLSAGASTVGIEVIALIIKKYQKQLNLAKLIRYLNYAILIVGLMIYGVKAVLVGILFSFLYSSFLDRLLQYYGQKYGEVM